MRAPVARWRPLAPRDLDTARTLIEDTLSAWQQAWFHAPAVQVESVALVAPRSACTFPGDACVYALGTSLRWSIAPDASRRLANLALDLPEDDSIAVGAVRAAPLLDLERHVTDELCAALASLCGDNAGNESRLCATPETHTRLQLPRGGVQLRVASNGGAELLSIVVTPALLHGKARAPGLPRSTPIKPLALRSDSLAPIEVRLSAVLGQAELSVQQLLGLEAGDVIAIDRTLDSPVDVIVEQRDGCGPRNLGTGHVGRTGRNLSIQLNAIHGRNAL